MATAPTTSPESAIARLRRRIRQQLAWRLGTLIGAVSLILLLLGGLSIAALAQFQAAVKTGTAAQNQARLAFEIRNDVQSYSAALLDMVWTRIDRTQELAGHGARFAEHLASARSQALPAEQALLAEVESRQAEFKVLAEEMVVLSQAGRDTEVAIKWIRGKNLAERTAQAANGYYAEQDRLAGAAQAAADRQGLLATILLISTLLLALLVGISVTAVLSRQIVRQLRTLTDSAQRVARQEPVQLPITSEDERAIFAHAFNSMVTDLASQRETLRHWSEELERNVSERTRELQTALRRQEELVATIRHMSTPVLPVGDGMIVIPLVGVLDSERMRQMQGILLNAISEFRAHTAILDITGMPIIDHEVAASMVAAIRQARLLGAACIIVGITPSVAETLVSLGISLDEIRALSTLRTAIALGGGPR